MEQRWYTFTCIGLYNRCKWVLPLFRILIFRVLNKESTYNTVIFVGIFFNWTKELSLKNTNHLMISLTRVLWRTHSAQAQ